ncbi:MAG: MoaD/ThiS family protein [Actinobacteria bacterium]|nr:MoaD/ThiS family protein [Actinomycetota bacterium]MBA3565368.1 MoaD/ThiS family protein [Actinomycetota bacterium]
MPVVKLRAPLTELTGGKRELQLDGATVRDVLQALENEHPAIAGWILDERTTIRQHINVFVNGERGREDTTLTPEDRIHVLPSISGG